MAHRTLEFPMPADASVVFDAFHYHCWRVRWDSLVARTRVVGGAPCPYVGAVTENQGAGWLRALSMQTRFVSFDRPRVAAAAMVGQSFPFTRWAASMRHKPVAPGHSLMLYSYTFEASAKPWLRWSEPAVEWFFLRQTMRRFGRLQAFLAGHAHEVVAWQALNQLAPFAEADDVPGR